VLILVLLKDDMSPIWPLAIVDTVTSVNTYWWFLLDYLVSWV